MTSNPEIPVTNLPFLDEIFFNSPLCQICEYASIFGGVCSLLLNRRIPVNLIVKNSQIVSCSAHRNWIQTIGELGESSHWNEFNECDDEDEISKLDQGQDPSG